MMKKDNKKVFSKKSKKYLLNLRNKKGPEYSNLILEECKSIIYDFQIGYCFNENQCHDIKQICLFEKIETKDIIFYDDIDKNMIDYISIERKNQIKKKVPRRCYSNKTNIKKHKNKTDLKKSLNKEEISINELKYNILAHYGFLEEVNV